MPVATKKQTKKFKVIRVSTNTNSFGLYGMWLLAQDGETWEVAVSQLNRKELGDVLELPYNREPSFSNLFWSAEIPERKSNPPQRVIDMVWKEGWKGGF